MAFKSKREKYAYVKGIKKGMNGGKPYAKLKKKKVYDVVYNAFADRKDFKDMPKQYQRWQTVCTCKDEKTAKTMLAMQNRLSGVSKIVSRDVN